MNSLMILFSLYVSGNVAFQMNYNLSNLDKFKKLLSQAKHVVVITGAGISVESGIPLFRGPDAYFRNREIRLLRTHTTFEKNPSLVWEFYHYRREIILTRRPNKAHYALVELENRCRAEGRNFTLITQNTDGLHKKAGSQNLIELYGSALRTRCTVCGDTKRNFRSPICPAFKRRRRKFNATEFKPIPVSELPRCKKEECDGLLRPDVVFFGEGVDPRYNVKLEHSLRNCDLCLIIGSSAKFYPVTEVANNLVWRRVPIAEFDIVSTAQTSLFQFHFEGPCTRTVPEALSVL